MEPLQFDPTLLVAPPTSGIDVNTTLSHFAIVTYEVEPEALRVHVHERFELDTITSADGSSKALVSVVPFLDSDFRFVCCPWPKLRFGQTNYRAYVTDTKTGKHVAWFFGTSLDSISVVVPRLVWRLPWHGARIRFECDYDESAGRYRKYSMNTKSDWAPAELEIEDSGTAPDELSGFPDLETGLVLLTHPLEGYFHRRDSRLGSYAVWHDRLHTTVGKLRLARFGLLDRLGLVSTGDISSVHSVLMQARTEFTIYLPPKRA